MATPSHRSPLSSFSEPPTRTATGILLYSPWLQTPLGAASTPAVASGGHPFHSAFPPAVAGTEQPIHRLAARSPVTGSLHPPHLTAPQPGHGGLLVHLLWSTSARSSPPLQISWSVQGPPCWRMSPLQGGHCKLFILRKSRTPGSLLNLSSCTINFTIGRCTFYKRASILRDRMAQNYPKSEGGTRGLRVLLHSHLSHAPVKKILRSKVKKRNS